GSDAVRCSPAPHSVFLSHPATAGLDAPSLHDALPIWTTPGRSSTCATRARTGSTRWRRRSTSPGPPASAPRPTATGCGCAAPSRSEEHTSELQSRENLVCRLLLEKKNEYRHRRAGRNL